MKKNTLVFFQSKRVFVFLDVATKLAIVDCVWIDYIWYRWNMYLHGTGNGGSNDACH